MNWNKLYQTNKSLFTELFNYICKTNVEEVESEMIFDESYFDFKNIKKFFDEKKGISIDVKNFKYDDSDSKRIIDSVDYQIFSYLSDFHFVSNYQVNNTHKNTYLALEEECVEKVFELISK